MRQPYRPASKPVRIVAAVATLLLTAAVSQSMCALAVHYDEAARMAQAGPTVKLAVR